MAKNNRHKHRDGKKRTRLAGSGSKKRVQIPNDGIPPGCSTPPPNNEARLMHERSLARR